MRRHRGIGSPADPIGMTIMECGGGRASAFATSRAAAVADIFGPEDLELDIVFRDGENVSLEAAGLDPRARSGDGASDGGCASKTEDDGCSGAG